MPVTQKRLNPMPPWVITAATQKLQHVNALLRDEQWVLSLWDEDHFAKVTTRTGDQRSPDFNHGYTLLTWLDGWLTGFDTSKQMSAEEFKKLQDKIEAMEYKEWHKPKVKIRCSGKLWNAYSEVNRGVYRLIAHEKLPAYGLGEALAAVADRYKGEPFEVEVERK